MKKPRFVSEIPDLIRTEDYSSDPDGRRVRVRLTITPDGVEVISDGRRPMSVEAVLASLDPEEIEQVLCG